MPSSTSSFDRGVPGRRWGVLLTAGLILALAMLAVAEVTLRRMGYSPTVIDDANLWSVARASVENDAAAIAILGNSQVQVGVSPAELASLLPGYHPAMLAVEGSSPLPVLEDLADDKNFIGTVVCTVGPSDFLPLVHSNQASLVRYYHRDFTWDDAGNRNIATFLEWRLVIFDPYANPRRLVQERLASNRIPGPRPVLTRPDRSREIDHRFVNVRTRRDDQLRRARELYERAQQQFSAEDWMLAATRAADAARRIEARGGTVLFVRLPLSGAAWEQEEHFFPRAQFWGAWVTIAGVRAVHFTDVAAFEGFVLPELVHVDKTGIRDYTRVLASLIEPELRTSKGP